MLSNFTFLALIESDWVYQDGRVTYLITAG